MLDLVECFFDLFFGSFLLKTDMGDKLSITLTHLISGIFFREKKILLGLRKKTKIYSGYWSLPVGHLEKGESEELALKRELNEELGVKIKDFHKIIEKRDEKKHIVHGVYHILSWQGEVENREPELCDKLQWFLSDDLPKNITPISLEIINEFYSEHK